MKRIILPFIIVLSLGGVASAQSVGTGVTDNNIDQIGVSTPAGGNGYADALEVQEKLASVPGPMATDTEIGTAVSAQAATQAAVDAAQDVAINAAGGSSASNDLTDVNTAGLATGDILQFDGTNFVPITLADLVGAINPDDIAAALTADTSSMQALASGIIDPSTSNTLVTANGSGLIFQNNAVVPSP